MTLEEARADKYWLEADAISLYKAYGEAVDFKNFQGNPMPAWEDLPEKIRQAWIAVTCKSQDLYLVN